jgi:hypothetical protein
VGVFTGTLLGAEGGTCHVPMAASIADYRELMPEGERHTRELLLPLEDVLLIWYYCDLMPSSAPLWRQP